MLVVTTTLLTMIFEWDCKGVAILNSVESVIPPEIVTYPQPTLPKIRHLLLSAILISVIGFVLILTIGLLNQ